MLAPDGGWWRNNAACNTPEALPLVDAAFDRPGGHAAKHLKTKYCATCPVATQCLTEAMENGEAGVWGGTSPKKRTQAGGVRISPSNSKRPEQIGVV